MATAFSQAALDEAERMMDSFGSELNRLGNRRKALIAKRDELARVCSAQNRQIEAELKKIYDEEGEVSSDYSEASIAYKKMLALSKQ